MKVEQQLQAAIPMDISKKIILNVCLAQVMILDGLNEIIKPYELSAEQYNVLRILRGQKDKPANMFMIQERMIAKTSNTTRLVDKLLAKDLVIRKVCNENKRKIEVFITQKGLDVLAELDSKVSHYEKKIAMKITDSEAEQLNNLLEKYRNQ